jgi:hypothetical protein
MSGATHAWQPALVTRARAKDSKTETALCWAESELWESGAMVTAREIEHALGIDLPPAARRSIETVLRSHGTRLLDAVAQRT